jgi:hypothetical protein
MEALQMESQMSADIVIHEIQGAEAPSTGKLVRDEVHGSVLIGTLCNR